MPRISLTVALASYAMITAGVVWLFGPWGLIACGAVLLVLSFFLDMEV